MLTKGEEKNIKKTIELPENINAPIKKGDKLGEVIISINDKEVGRHNLVCDSDVTRASLINNLKNSFRFWFGDSKK